MPPPPPSDLLFPTSLISPKVQSALPPTFTIRPLSSSDYHRGFLTALSHLTTVGEYSYGSFVDRFTYMRAHQYEYFVVVIVDDEKDVVAASGTIFVERKFVHANGLVGHIEDIVVHEAYRKLKFGKHIIDQLKHIGRDVGCYKVILDCSEKNVPFYEKCGFERKEVEMAWYIEKTKAKL